MLISVLLTAFAVDLPSDIDTMSTLANDHSSHDEPVNDAAATRLQPSTFERKLQRLVDRLENTSCASGASLTYVAGAYEGTALTGDDALANGLVGTLDRGTRAVSGSIGATGFGESVGSYTNGQFVTDTDEGGFFAGTFARVAGQDGVFMGLHGICDLGGTAAEALDGWYRGDASEVMGCGETAVPNATAASCLTCGSSTLLDDGPLLYWSLDETGGTSIANQGSLGSTADGTLSGDIDLSSRGVTGAPSGGAEFMDTTGSIVWSDESSSMATDAISAMAFVRTSVTDEATPFSYAAPDDNNAFILIYGPSQTRLFVAGGNVATDATPNDGEWHHVAVTWQSSDGALHYYIDGEEVYAGATAMGNTLTPGGVWVVGQEQDSLGGGFDTDQSFRGRLDDVALFDRALSADEVVDHYRTLQCDVD